MADKHIVDTDRDKKGKGPVLDSFWRIAQYYNISYQELKQLNKGKGAENGGYNYEQRTPAWWLNNGDVVLLPKKQPPNKELRKSVAKCELAEKPKEFLPIAVAERFPCGRVRNLAGAIVIISKRDRSYFKTTNTDGQALFENLDKGTYSIEVTSAEYDVYTGSFPTTT